MSRSDSGDEKNRRPGYEASGHLKGAALGILVMGVSLAAIIALWAWFGHEGPDFSTRVLQQQQEWLHEVYNLPKEPDVSPEMLEVPPSLRNLTSAPNSTVNDDVRPT